MPQVSGIRIPESWPLLGSDLVRLASDLRVTGCYLADTATHARHLLHPLASSGLSVIGRGWIPAWEWRWRMLEAGLSDPEMDEIFRFLNLIAGLRVRRSPIGHARRLAAGIRAFAMTGHYPVMAERLPATPAGTAGATLRACLPVTAATALVTAVAYAAGAAPYALTAVMAGFLMSLHLGTACHEYAHIAVIRKSFPGPCLVRRGMRLAVLHPPLGPAAEALAAAVGPPVGMTASLAGAALPAALLHARLPLWIGAGTALLHLTSFLPPYGDGQALLSFINHLLHAEPRRNDADTQP